jgi:hypothetical protein
MKRFSLLALICIAGCSAPALEPAPSEITGATLRTRDDGQPLAQIPATDARSIYGSLKADEPNVLVDEAYTWEPYFIIAFDTRSAGVIEVGLEQGFDLWMPMGVRFEGDREVPESTRILLSRYVEPIGD